MGYLAETRAERAKYGKNGGANFDAIKGMFKSLEDRKLEGRKPVFDFGEIGKYIEYSTKLSKPELIALVKYNYSEIHWGIMFNKTADLEVYAVLCRESEDVGVQIGAGERFIREKEKKGRQR